MSLPKKLEVAVPSLCWYFILKYKLIAFFGSRLWWGSHMALYLEKLSQELKKQVLWTSLHSGILV